MLVVVSGLPGTGKTTVADDLARRLTAVRVSVDLIEERMLGSGLPASWETGVAAYRVGAAVAEGNLANGHTVVVDAVNESEAARDTWRSAAARARADVLFVVLTLDDAAEHRRRVETRAPVLVHVPLPSWADVLDRAASSEAWAGADSLAVDAGSPIGEVVEQVLAHLRAR